MPDPEPSAFAAASATTASTAEQPEQRAAAWKVTAKINKSKVIAGEDVVRIKGRVTPKAAGQKVLLQQRLATQKKWNKAGTFKIKANGTFVATDKPNAPGPRSYRVVMQAGKGLRQGVSKPVSTTVYRWRELGGFSRAGEGTEITSGSVANDDFYPVLTLSDGVAAGAAEYTVGRKCVTLEARYAMLDTSPTGTSGSVAVSTDGAVRLTRDLTIGGSFDVATLDISDVFRLKFDLTATAGGYPGVLEPRVLCAS
jgi:hypothetical protein